MPVWLPIEETECLICRVETLNQKFYTLPCGHGGPRDPTHLSCFTRGFTAVWPRQNPQCPWCKAYLDADTVRDLRKQLWDGPGTSGLTGATLMDVDDALGEMYQSLEAEEAAGGGEDGPPGDPPG